MSDKLAGCDPALVKKVLAVIADLRGYGYTLTVTEGKRSKARQAWLYAQGRVRPGKIVTWTMASRHLTGKAVDLAFLDKRGRPSWDDSYPWALIGKSATVHGLIWGVPARGGGRKDLGHLELP